MTFSFHFDILRRKYQESIDIGRPLELWKNLEG